MTTPSRSPDPMGVNAATRAVLADPDYVAAFDAILSGTPEGSLPPEQSRKLATARELTGTTGPGLPTPIREGSR